MQKFVLKLDLQDDRDKRNALKVVSSCYGIDSVSVDMKEKKLTVIGDADPVQIVSKLRKKWMTELVSVGPNKVIKKEELKPQVPQGKQKSNNNHGGDKNGGGNKRNENGEGASRENNDHVQKAPEIMKKRFGERETVSKKVY